MRLVGNVTRLDDDRLVVEIYEGLVDFDLLGQKVVVNVDKFRNKKSEAANHYFWHLVDVIARKLRLDRSSIYFWLLKEGGVAVHMNILEEALPTLKRQYRLIEELNRFDGFVEIMCYIGLSEYDSAQTSYLIDVAHQKAIDIGCDAYTDEELEQLKEGISEKN